MIKRYKMTIPSLSDEIRRVYVYLPNSYKKDKDKYYPVLYMFDGHNVFYDSHATYGKSWGMKSYMDYTNTELIIAAVECSHGLNNERLKEYSPYDFYDEEFGEIKGQGKLTMDWFVKFFKPFIDSHFRTLKDREHTFIAGSSMGGLMSLYALIAYNNVFSRACALSPFLWANKYEIIRLIKKSKIDENTEIYIDYGSKEFDDYPEVRKPFMEICNELYKKGIFVTSRVVPYGEHSESSWEAQVPIFINVLME